MARWSSVIDPRPIYYQDVRDRGPLYDLSKMELDPDPESAKQQWRNLCVQHQQKQKIATELWDANKELEVRCCCTEAENIRFRDMLASTSQVRKGLKADIKWLETRCNSAEAKHEHVKELLDTVTQTRMELTTDNVRLAAEVQRTKKAMRELRDVVAVQEKQLTALTGWKHWYARDAARKRVFLLAKQFALAVLPIAGTIVIVSIMAPYF